MEDKIQQARRAAFEGWWLSEGLTLNDPTYGRYTTTTQAAWMGFNAALDCVVIELPDSNCEAQDHYMLACERAIESTNLGIKVK